MNVSQHLRYQPAPNRPKLKFSQSTPSADNIASIYVLPEGLTRAQHASRLNDLDQFAREAYERGATLTENVLSIPRDPDSRPRDETKVTIGTEAHAINFVRSFIDDPKLAEEKGKLLFEIADKACGQWMDSDGRLTVFNHIYTEIRQDQSGAYRDNEQKAQVIDEVLAETAEWAQPLRIRWTHPVTHHREGMKRAHPSREAAEAWVERMQRTAATGVDTGQTLAAYVEHIGDRWTRGIDPTSTYDPYSAGLRRVLPTLGHLPVAMITAGLVDRAIDEWEKEYGRSTVKNTVAALVLVLDEAVRDGIIVRNPAKDRARRRRWAAPPSRRTDRPSRSRALPDVTALERLVAGVIETGGRSRTAMS